MSKFEKALLRLKSRPRDFTWKELQMIMAHLGYDEIKGSGSRRKFYNKTSRVSISLHEPHPKPTIKPYAIDIILDHFKEEGLI
ncbi:MAG: type II toxin-antitoxin system HicA family toxin [Cyclobacteriaceae bacterium]